MLEEINGGSGMNRYDELVNWLQEEHNEVFHQWAQIEAELDRKLEGGMKNESQ